MVENRDGVEVMKKWKKSEEVISDFKEENSEGRFETVSIGIVEVNPQKIVALNLDYHDIENDYKMKRLKEKVKQNGWIDVQPQDLCLLQLPNGDLLVNGGGNHRAVLSNEFGLTCIKADVFKVIDLDKISVKDNKRLREIDTELCDLVEYLEISCDSKEIPKRINLLEVEKLNIFRSI